MEFMDLDPIRFNCLPAGSQSGEDDPVSVPEYPAPVDDRPGGLLFPVLVPYEPTDIRPATNLSASSERVAIAALTVCALHFAWR